MSWRRLIYFVLKTSNLQRLQDVWLTTSWRNLKINDLEKLLYLCYLAVPLREVTIHIQNLWNLVFPRIRKGSSLCGFDCKEHSEKGLRQWKKVSLSWKPSLCEVVCEEKKQFWNSCDHFKAHKKSKSPIQTSIFLYFRDRPKNGEWNKLRRHRKYMRKSN